MQLYVSLVLNNPCLYYQKKVFVSKDRQHIRINDKIHSQKEAAKMDKLNHLFMRILELIFIPKNFSFMKSFFKKF